MIKSFIPPRLTTLTVAVCLILWFFNFHKISLFLICIYFIFYILFRKNRYRSVAYSKADQGAIYSPVNGKIVNIQSNISHLIFGEKLTEIQIQVSWFDEYGVYLPISSEVTNLQVMKGISFFRLFKFDKVIGTKEGKGLNLKLDNLNQSVGLSLYKCRFGLWPEVIIMPGDKGIKRANIGYFPFGGTVLVYLPQNYEILLQINDEVTATESILAVTRDKK